MLLTAIKILHTLVVVVMFTAILFLLYSGITGQLSKWTTIAFVVISIEVVIYVGNGFRCPLTKMAERLTPAGHPVFDILLPRLDGRPHRSRFYSSFGNGLPFAAVALTAKSVSYKRPPKTLITLPLPPSLKRYR
jgi:hypothetical protein